ncbi:hypothetical protein BDN72DRAFT_956191 [Pluteus cervinus]|uniref:Uncharacterized protein n=1 Tax=Pluteus cervinus TaxID=181527 RepID=A0ACD3B7G0_9AGAR|nr:hypothetical protein BDN72DRAFT_956191 [Pluteus cervinus]
MFDSSFKTFPTEIHSLILSYHQPYVKLGVDAWDDDDSFAYDEQMRFASELCLVNRAFYCIMQPLLHATFFVYLSENDLVNRFPVVQKNHRWITRLVFWGEESPDEFPDCPIWDFIPLCENLKTLELIDFHKVFDVHYTEGADDMAQKFLSPITSTQLTTLSILTREEDPLEFEGNEAPVTILQHLTKEVAARIELLIIDYWGSGTTELERIPRQRFSSLRRLELLHVQLMEDYPCDFMKALTSTSPSLDVAVASTPPIRELHAQDMSEEFADVFFTRILPTNNLGLGLRYLYFSILHVGDSESLSSFPLLLSQQCPQLEVLLYFVPCPVTFLDNLPVRLKKFGVMLWAIRDVYSSEEYGTPRLCPESILEWANDAERRREIETLVIAWGQRIDQKVQDEAAKQLESGVRDIHLSISNEYSS